MLTQLDTNPCPRHPSNLGPAKADGEQRTHEEVETHRSVCGLHLRDSRLTRPEELGDFRLREIPTCAQLLERRRQIELHLDQERLPLRQAENSNPDSVQDTKPTSTLAPMATPTPPQYVRDDYDGDGITDVAVYETAIGYVAVYNEITGQWSYRRSSDDALAGTTLGGPGFLAVPADFGGGGKADVAVYQVRNGAWTYIASSTGMQVSLGTFGAARFAPVPADYDGDGKVDAGAYRKSSGGWRYRSSWTGMKTSLPTLGGTGFVPVVGIRLRCPSRGR